MPLIVLGVLPDCHLNEPSNEWKLADMNKNSIPDFSHVGYRGGHIKIPMVPVRTKPLEPYQNGRDDTNMIQAAINEVGRLPLITLEESGIEIRGAVLLKKGHYYLPGSLAINKRGVVLRGEGPDWFHGTVLHATARLQGNFISVDGALPSQSRDRFTSFGLGIYGPPLNLYLPSGKPETRIRGDVYIPVGTTTLPVDDTTGFSVHDKIVVGYNFDYAVGAKQV
ncbi:hypothetical protein EC968_007288 [Mortierella alpina]|nr:hypothetical protein EC968_007288 [Mortierella alpina]